MESFSLSLSWFPAHPAHPFISLFSFFFLLPAAHGAPSAHSPLPVQSASPPSLPLSPTGGPCLSGLSSSSRPTGTRAEPESDRVSPRRGLRGAHAKDSPLTPIKGSARSPKPHEPVADALAPLETLTAAAIGALELGAAAADLPLRRLPIDLERPRNSAPW